MAVLGTLCVGLLILALANGGSIQTERFVEQENLEFLKSFADPRSAEISLLELNIEDERVTMETIVLQGEELLRGCSGYECHVCVKAILEVCLTARYLKENIGFSVDLTVNGHSVFHKEISVANPPAVCVNKVPGLSRLVNLCLQLYDVNLRDRSACARVVFVLKVGPLKKKFKLKIGCFRIPIANSSENEISFDWSALE